MKRKAFSATMLTLPLIVMLTLPSNVNTVAAYKSGIPSGTHWFIFDRAKTILGNDGYLSYADFLDSVEPSSGLTYLEIMMKGSEEHDDLISAREHYMDPMDHRGLWFFGLQKSAGTLAQERFDEAVSRWQTGNGYDAMYNLGWAAHLVQDVTVPHHAWTTYSAWHSQYEDWVRDNGYLYAVDSGGVYSFPSFIDSQYYIPGHYSWVNISAYNWVDYNAHQSIKHFLSVNSYTSSYVTDAADPYVETLHPLQNNLETTWVITTCQTSGMQLHFEKIDMQNGFDYVQVYDKYDTLLNAYTGQYTDFWTPWYSVGDTLKIKVSTDFSVQSWGYKIKEVKYFDTGENQHGTASVLFPLAQRTTAGFIKFFFDKVLNPIYIRSDGSVEPSTAPIQRNGNIYTFSNNVNRSIVIEKDNIIVNGDDRVLQGAYNVGDGFYLSGRNNVTIQDTTVAGFWSGIFVHNSANITLTRNTILNNNEVGIYLYKSSSNWIFGSDITDNTFGIRLDGSSSNNQIYCNNFVGNTEQVYIEAGCANSWDAGYPSGGNYWGDYADVDLFTGPYQNITGNDGVWDRPYIIDANNRDDYPLTTPWSSLIGDIDGDCDVDADDLRILPGVYGTRLGGPNYHSRADLDKDGDVNLYDLYMLARNYGKT